MAAPAPATPTSQNYFPQDFELFGPVPATQTTTVQHSRAQATSTTPHSLQTCFTGHRQQSLNSQSQSAEPISTSFSNRSNSNLLAQKPGLVASNANSSFTSLQQRRTRPPVPPFPNRSTDNLDPQSKTSALELRVQSAANTPQDMDLLDHLHLPTSATPFDTSNLYTNSNLDAKSSWTAIDRSRPGHSSSTADTVSPKDIINDSSVMSAPSSTAFPNLSTPGSGYLESPYLGNSSLGSLGSMDTSPVNGDGALDAELDFHNYPSLFPDVAEHCQKPTMHANSSFTSVSSGYNGASPMIRQNTSPGHQPVSAHARKHSTSSGVRPSKQHKPLPDIVLDPVKDSREDMKRKKNTAAARKSRQRKLETSEALQTENERLSEEVERLKQVVCRLGGSPDM